ncbi:carbon-nitrogen hydrolase family protein [Microlunatus elymi]|uniref:Carbon-nitrogen hydrolase family protein n=2 Tax=Microlunatus elymi TaxID=2596828 RepID=A0A516Q6A4_9ACTN|nr:carbon-nitrogen hydrolase family protein [Microlunatus elymi]
MREAERHGARMIQFAEGALSSYPDKRLMSSTADLGPADWSKADWPVLEEELSRTAALAGHLRLWTVLGSVHRSTRLVRPDGERRPYNSLYVISDTGRLVHRYDKRLISHSELSYLYAPGIDPLVFEVDGWRFGTALCIEINFAEVFAEYERLDVDCVLFSSFSEDPMFGVLARGHAAANSNWMTFSVPAQCSAAVPSGVVGPDGRWIAQGPTDGTESLVVVDLDPADSEPIDIAVRHRRPWRRLVRQRLGIPHSEEPAVADTAGSDRPRTPARIAGTWCHDESG